MNWGHLMFGFSGRINRAKIWLWLLIILAVVIVIGMIAGVITVVSDSGTPVIIAYAVVGIGALISYLAVLTERLHDRNKSAAWLLLFVLLPLLLAGASMTITLGNLNDMMDGGMDGPTFMGGILSLIGLAISIWAFVELWCLRGSVGPNSYGPDPLESRS